MFGGGGGWKMPFYVGGSGDEGDVVEVDDLSFMSAVDVAGRSSLALLAVVRTLATISISRSISDSTLSNVLSSSSALEIVASADGLDGAVCGKWS